MNAIILLLFAADPTGLQAALESADSMDMSFDRTWFTVTLVNPDTVRKMAALIEVKGEARKLPGTPSTEEIIRVTLHSGQKKTEFWLFGNDKIVFGDNQMIKVSDKLWTAMRPYFEPPDVVFGPPIDGPEPLPPVVAAKTLKAAFECKTLDLKNITTSQSSSLTKESAIKQLAGLMRFNGDVSYMGKPEAKNTVEVALSNDETKIRFFVLGDTLAWGTGGKHYKQIKLADDKLYLAMLATIASNPAPKPASLKNSRDDMTGLMAALESADSVELTHRATGKKATIKGKALKSLIPLAADNKGATGAMAPGNKFLEKKEVIDISVRKGEVATDFILVRGGDDATLVFGPQNLLAKMTNLGLWQELRAQFPVESAFPPKPK